MSARVPPPLEWHPAYAGHTHLLDWLQDTGPDAGYSTLRIPVLPSLTKRLLADLRGDPEPAGVPLPEEIVLTKHSAVGLAPYVGRPFIYKWRVATDHLGRAVAGDSWIVYTDGGAR